MHKKLASDVKPGDVLRVPGADLHDDSAGLVCEIVVREATNDHGEMRVTCMSGLTVWWKPGKVVICTGQSHLRRADRKMPELQVAT